MTLAGEPRHDALPLDPGDAVLSIAAPPPGAINDDKVLEAIAAAVVDVAMGRVGGTEILVGLASRLI